jgi:hypothetical protein
MLLAIAEKSAQIDYDDDYMGVTMPMRVLT